jgi:hypothetical protein
MVVRCAHLLPHFVDRLGPTMQCYVVDKLLAPISTRA